MLHLSDLSIGYRKHALLSHIRLSAAEGELVALIGRNGTGKSTLMRTIARLQPKLSGEVLLSGKPAESYSRSDWAEKLSIVSTETVGELHLTVRQLVAFGRFPYTNWIGKLTEKDIAAVEEAMQLVDMAHLAGKNLHETSDGERQRAMIARTLAQDTGVILLDEPTAYLDMPNKYEVIRLLHHLTRNKGKTIIFSTHDLNIAMQEADKLWLITGNRLQEGAPEDMALNRQLEQLFEASSLHFDDSNGEFKIKRTNLPVVALYGEGKNAFWTQKALERTGFSVLPGKDDTAAGQENFSVSVSERHPPVWTLHRNGEELQADSIFELCRQLNKSVKYPQNIDMKGLTDKSQPIVSSGQNYA
ncbi:MAG: ABC transporter ATP-binding protein [Bacteroidales bacterium]|jgi:iron complex transport system ATP-binding protein|nr:ABC transporter ATP-binding protein [Bacteroidales bacterium]